MDCSWLLRLRCHNYDHTIPLVKINKPSKITKPTLTLMPSLIHTCIWFFFHLFAFSCDSKLYKLNSLITQTEMFLSPFLCMREGRLTRAALIGFSTKSQCQLSDISWRKKVFDNDYNCLQLHHEEVGSHTACWQLGEVSTWSLHSTPCGLSPHTTTTTTDLCRYRSTCSVGKRRRWK